MSPLSLTNPLKRFCLRTDLASHLSISCCNWNSLPRKFLAIGVLLLVLLWLPSSASAQCPTGWTGIGTTTLNIMLLCGSPPVPITITISVDYCTPGPDIVPQTQYKVKEVRGVPAGCTFDGLALRAIARALIRTNPEGFSCEGICPSLFPTWQTSWNNCWKSIPAGNGTLQWVVCNTSPAAEACLDLYAVCCKCNGTLIPFYQGSQPSTGSCSDDPACTYMCPGPAPVEPVTCN